MNRPLIIISLILAILLSVGCVEECADSGEPTTYDSSICKYTTEWGDDIYIDSSMTAYSTTFEQEGDFTVHRYYDPELKSWIMLVHEEDKCLVQTFIFDDAGNVRASSGSVP